MGPWANMTHTFAKSHSQLSPFTAIEYSLDGTKKTYSKSACITAQTMFAPTLIQTAGASAGLTSASESNQPLATSNPAPTDASGPSGSKPGKGKKSTKQVDGNDVVMQDSVEVSPLVLYTATMLIVRLTRRS